GLVQLRRMGDLQRRRQEVVNAYMAGFAELAAEGLLELPVHRPHVDHAWHLFVLRLRPDRLRIGRDAFITAMTEQNIATSVHFIPVHLHPYYRDRYGFAPTDFPVAYDAYSRMVSLPLHPRLADGDVADVIAAVHRIVRANRL
ncbi:MAG: DegT/DnrJ/EryC1/StrS family aminotransferase, partial [Gemmatimonas sp.]